MSADLNAFPNLPLCAWCGDSGIVHHEIWDPPYRWCEASGCSAAEKTRATDPEAVRRSNHAVRMLWIGAAK